jgi:hypothetical protein
MNEWSSGLKEDNAAATMTHPDLRLLAHRLPVLTRAPGEIQLINDQRP